MLTFKHIIVSMRGTKVTIAGLKLTYNTTNKLSYRAEKCHWHIFWQLRGNGRQYKTIQKNGYWHWLLSCITLYSPLFFLNPLKFSFFFSALIWIDVSLVMVLTQFTSVSNSYGIIDWNKVVWYIWKRWKYSYKKLMMYKLLQKSCLILT